MYQYLYQRFLNANQGKQHFACHSHHYWPDVTREAMLDYWDDSARLVDDKWDYLFTTKLPLVQQHIARILNTNEPEQIVFAPNTHELVYRILSCLDWCQPVNILTTDSEFHSFSRQVKRLDESDNLNLTQVATLPAEDFEARFTQALNEKRYDLVFLSQVFFNSGIALQNPEAIVNAVRHSDTIVVIDGYHGFMALPTDLNAIKDRIFYLAGSYKYAQGGEGACFAHIPSGCTLRPAYTGWFAGFGELSQAQSDKVFYADNGMRFGGATMDMAPVYRLHAVLELFEREGLPVDKIHGYVQQCQQQFLAILDNLSHPELNRDQLLSRDLDHHGHFLTFKLSSAEKVQALAEHLRQHGIITDARGDRLRFGFALYHNPQDYDLSCLEHSNA
ncbi:hypothetical protein HMF8227_02830 [Saliniradius amylolyticus]|uniref:Aminotransferase class V domain-containing protein n=1 Tax=Saliniradius amylolyticus TaxID=2183582 RepID=A0A2S2E6Q1_9ALTE|nr:aminotransferase class V-fold PLP-dependent enzyme [Saliniradius amylolyticus]AWL13279.1 hypothetical protein HMF8227_02830 [Saliniradius amylolyticus]